MACLRPGAVVGDRLASYSASDPVLFFSTPTAQAAQLRRARRRVPRRARLPGARLRRLPAAGGARRHRLALLLGARAAPRRGPSSPAASCSSPASARPAGIAFERLPIGGKPFPAGGALGAGVAGLLTDQLNRSGALVLVLTALFLSLLMVTQLSFGAVAAAIGARVAAFVERPGRRDRRLARGAPPREAAPGGDPQAPREGHGTRDRRASRDEGRRGARRRRQAPGAGDAGATAAGKASAAAKGAGLDDDDDDRPIARPPRAPRRRPGEAGGEGRRAADGPVA